MAAWFFLCQDSFGSWKIWQLQMSHFFALVSSVTTQFLIGSPAFSLTDVPTPLYFPPVACFLLLKSFCSVLFSENMSSCFWTGFPFSDRWHIVNEFLLAGFNCQLSHSHRNSTIWCIQVYFQFLLYWTMNSKKWQGRWIKWKGGDMYGSSS